jgi:hypothetical protein
MFYIEDLAAHELHGPFTTRELAHTYAKLREIGAYAILTDKQAQQSRYAQDDASSSFRLVPAEYR